MNTTMTSIVELDRPMPTTKGWFPDPDGLHKLRYHDGREWTGHVTHFGPTPCRGCRR